jgi:hypothetical protein
MQVSMRTSMSVYASEYENEYECACANETMEWTCGVDVGV